MTTAPLSPVRLLAAGDDLDRFDSGAPDLDRWLRNSAHTAHAAGTAATYVLCRGDRVIGFYAVAMSAIAHAEAPPRLRRGMPDPVPVVLLARLALDRSEQGNHLGGYLLVDALRRCVKGGREFGARAVIIDAYDDRAAAFYRHFDFRDLQGTRPWRRIADIAATLDAGRP